MNQKRVLLALILSSTILIAWSYFFPPVKPPQNNQPGASASPTATADAAPAGQTVNANPTPSTPVQVANLTTAPKRTITIETPYYLAKFETLGAEPVSWVITKNRHSKSLIYSVKGKKSDKFPLELISSEGLNRQPRMAPA